MANRKRAIDSRDVAEQILPCDGLLLGNLSEQLRDDKDLVLAAVRQDGIALTFASKRLKSDPDVVRAAVQQDGRSISSASDKLKRDPEIALIACTQNYHAFFSVGVPNNMPDVAIAALRQEFNSDKTANVMIHALQGMPQADRRFYKEALDANPKALMHCLEPIVSDKELVAPVVAKDGTLLKYCNRELRDDRELVLSAVKFKGAALQYASYSLRNDPDIALTAIESSYAAMLRLGPKLAADREFVKKALLINGSAFQFVAPEFKKDHELVKIATERYPWSLGHASHQLQQDPTIVFDTIARNGKVVLCSTKEFQQGKVLRDFLTSELQTFERFVYFQLYARVRPSDGNHLTKLNAHGTPFAILFKRKIMDFAGAKPKEHYRQLQIAANILRR